MMKKYLIDVRSRDEFNEGAAEGAIHHDIYDILGGELPKVPKDAEIHLYCLSGARAEMARKILLEQGFTNVTNAGGLKEVREKQFVK